MRKYVCHKKVKAIRIAEALGVFGTGEAEYAKFRMEDNKVIVVRKDFYARYMPVAGDYLVEYEDGYQSFSPQAAFEQGYTEQTDENAAGDTANQAKLAQSALGYDDRLVRATALDLAIRSCGGAGEPADIVAKASTFEEYLRSNGKPQ